MRLLNPFLSVAAFALCSSFLTSASQLPSDCTFTQTYDTTTSKCVEVDCGNGFQLNGSTCVAVQTDCSGTNKPASCSVINSCTARPSNATKKWIALTFEGGPFESSTTSMLLAALADADVKATFFFQGALAARVPWLVRRALESGHVIGSYGHAGFPLTDKISLNTSLDELQQAEMAIYRATYRKSSVGLRPRFFRLPQGIVSSTGVKAANQTSRPYTIVGANLDIRSYELPTTDTAVRQLLERVSGVNSYIYVGRDNGTMFIDGIKNIIAYLKGNNYTFVTMDECLGKSAYLSSDFATPLYAPVYGFSISESDIVTSSATILSVSSVAMILSLSAFFAVSL